MSLRCLRRPYGRIAGTALLVAVAACTPPAAVEQWAHPHRASDPLVGRIFAVHDGVHIDEPQLVKRLAAADFVLLGETHDNRDHHRLQARLVRAIARASRRPLTIAFEMLPTDLQERIDAALHGTETDLARFAEAVAWEESGWPPFDYYEPVFRAAVEVGARIAAAGLPRAQISAIAEQGAAALPQEFVRRTGIDEPLPDALRAALEEELFASHCGRLPRDLVPRMIAVQRARDALLADRLVDATGDGLGILITGKGHARLDRGVPYYLRRLAPQRRVLAVAFVEVGSIPPESFAAQPYDYLWFTPHAHPEDYDPCATIRPRRATG